MTKRGRLLTLFAVLAFAGFLLWSTLSSQRVECTVEVAFNNSRNTATASAASETDATREAQPAGGFLPSAVSAGVCRRRRANREGRE